MTHTKSNIVQYNACLPELLHSINLQHTGQRRQEYYPFGLQTQNSWTRENSTNNFLYNAGSELNSTTSNYEMFFREYDPALGRMNQVDPMASKYASLTPYNYAFNDPVFFNDPLGDDASDPSRGFNWYNYGRNSDGERVLHDAHAGGGMYGSSFDRADAAFAGLNAIASGGSSASWNSMTFGGGFAKYGVGRSIFSSDTYFQTPLGDWVSAQEVLAVDNPNQSQLWRFMAFNALLDAQKDKGNCPECPGSWKWFKEGMIEGGKSLWWNVGNMVGFNSMFGINGGIFITGTGIGLDEFALRRMMRDAGFEGHLDLKDDNNLLSILNVLSINNLLDAGQVIIEMNGKTKETYFLHSGQLGPVVRTENMVFLKSYGPGDYFGAPRGSIRTKNYKHVTLHDGTNVLYEID